MNFSRVLRHYNGKYTTRKTAMRHSGALFYLSTNS